MSYASHEELQRAEIVGFEPTEGLSTLSVLAGQRLNPLSHISIADLGSDDFPYRADLALLSCTRIVSFCANASVPEEDAGSSRWTGERLM